MNKKNALRIFSILVLIGVIAGVGFYSFQAIVGNESPIRVQMGPSDGSAPNTGNGFRFTFP